MSWMPLALLALTALPDGGLETPRANTVLEVALGRTAVLSVGFARGLQCDDLAVISADLKGGTGSNTLVVKGLKLGSTLCRAGTGRDGVATIVEVHVVPAPPEGASSHNAAEAPDDQE